MHDPISLSRVVERVLSARSGFYCRDRSRPVPTGSVAAMTNKPAFTRRGGPPWPPVSDMFILVVALCRHRVQDRHGGLSLRITPCRTPANHSPLEGHSVTREINNHSPLRGLLKKSHRGSALNFTPPLRGSR